MAPLRILSFNCHGYNIGTLHYLRQKCSEFDILLLQETWLSNETSNRLNDISSDFTVLSEMTYNVSMGTLNPTIPYLHTSAMEDKINDDYLSGRPFGGTVVMYNNSLPTTTSDIQKAFMVCHDSNRHQKSMEGILEVGSGCQCPLGGRPHNPATRRDHCCRGRVNPSTTTVVSPEPFPHRPRALRCL